MTVTNAQHHWLFIILAYFFDIYGVPIQIHIYMYVTYKLFSEHRAVYALYWMLQWFKVLFNDALMRRIYVVRKVF